ncbi:MAG TPA: Hpt domain-containing protein [Burkholderiales bacterium]|nr:Hpt domain-containing protein [Burkholderiales bacterium]
MTLDTRISLLTLVRQPIESNLRLFSDAAARHIAAAANNAELIPFVAQLHQVGGALRMVRLAGAARFASEIETALKAALRGTPADKTDIATADRAASVLREFVNAIAGGGTYVPLQLFSVYRELAHVSGNTSASEKDLFFPEIQDDVPPHANPRDITLAVLPALLKDLRSRYQRGLLGWLRESTKADGLTQMRGVLDQLHQIAAQLPEPRSLWWAAVTLIDGVIELLPEPQAAEWIARVKPVCSRLDFLLRDLMANAHADTTPAQRDVFYAIASCRTATPQFRDAQRLLQLEGLIPDTRPAVGAAASHQPLLDDARTRLDNIKSVWTEYIAGEPKRLGRLRELLVPLTQKTGELGNASLSQLLLAITEATSQLPDPYPLDGQVMSLEMASALLMAENIVNHFHDLPPDLGQQIALMKSWLADAVAGKVTSKSPPGLRADIVQKANDEKLRIATAREILKSLQQVEKTVEAYASDPSKHATLKPLAATLRQVRGVFEVSNQKRAARLAIVCQQLLERCAVAGADPSQHDIEWLAEGLGTLGFYLDPCLHGKEPSERAINLYFTRYEHQQGFEALLGLSQQIAVAAPPAAQAVPPATAPVPAHAGADREMLEIFLEEASEVLTTMESSLAQARQGAADHDALINVRRGFHTLKGSARMVGLGAYGECAWEMEQVMNHWLAQTLAATPELFALAGDARALLAEWAHALQGEAAPGIDASDITRRARELRGEAPEARATSAVGDVATATESSPTPAPLLPAAPSEAASPAAAAARDPSTATTVVAFPVAPAPAAGPSPAPPADVPETLLTISTLPMQATAGVAHTTTTSYEQTLGDLGDRLSWLNGLVEEIQEQAAASNSTGTRVNEIAQMMGESMSEALALHRELREQLDAHKNNT